MKRRVFIKNTAALTLPVLINGIPVSALSGNPSESGSFEDNDKVLVLIQLQGGNDGLHTLIPLDQYDKLAAVRNDIILPRSSILEISDNNGFHPSMTGFKEIWEKDMMAIVQSAGYPNQNRSHFRSTDIWNSGSSANEFISSGWLGRFFDLDHVGFPSGYPNNEFPHPLAITVGSGVNETCQGVGANYSMALVDPFNPGTVDSGLEGDTPENCFGSEVGFVRDIAKQTNAYSEEIITAANLGNNLSAKYDEIAGNQLAAKMAIIARLISGGLKTRVYVVQLGTFDTHGNQVNDNDKTQGKHADLLKELSDALSAFLDDLELLNVDKQVIAMTYSEFGRRIRSNASLGTDHGTAAPMFIFGSCLQNGILGENPEIDTQVGDSEGLPMQYDFRDVYGTVLSDWLGIDEDSVRSILFDEFNPLPLIKDCSSSSTLPIRENHVLEVDIYPNPVRDVVKIGFTGSSLLTRISIFDSMGNEVQMIGNKRYPPLKQVLDVDISNLRQGAYFLRIANSEGQKTKKFIKQ